MYFLLIMEIFHCYVSLPEGITGLCQLVMSSWDEQFLDPILKGPSKGSQQGEGGSHQPDKYSRRICIPTWNSKQPFINGCFKSIG